MIRLLGIDPGLRFTGWGVHRGRTATGCAIVADGVIATDSGDSVPDRLRALHDGWGR